MNYFNINKDNYKNAGLSTGMILGCLLVLTNNVVGSSYNHLLLNSEVSQDTVVIDFDQGNFTSGDLVSQINYPDGSITVFGRNPDFPLQNTAMIFDSGNPTGGDFDLGTPNELFGGPGISLDGGSVESNNVPMNNIIIVSEDLDSNDPDDAIAEAISLTFEFSAPVTLVSVDLLDLDSGEATLLLFDSLGNEIFSSNIPETGDNGVSKIIFNVVPSVAKMHINLNGSGAIDNITFVTNEESGEDPGSNAPKANDDVYDISKNTELTIEAPGVLGNDTDPNGDELSVIAYDSTGSKGGTVMLNPDGSFTFTPVMDSIDTDTFTYIVSDGNGNTDTAMVSIVIKDPRGGSENSPPIAEDDEFMTDQDLELAVTDSIDGILINDSDPDGDNIAALEVSNAITDQGGSISINSDGTFTYTPSTGFVGVDIFEYTVCDDQDPQLCDKAFISIEVKELPVKIFDAFSPNGDGINDIWIIQGITRFPNNHVQIFNRWGNLVYQVTGYDNSANAWQGQSTEGITFGKNEVPDGGYFYVIDLGDGSKELSGFVIIRR